MKRGDKIKKIPAPYILSNANIYFVTIINQGL